MHSHDQYKYRLYRKSGYIVLRGCLMSIWSFYIPKCFSIISPLSNRGKNVAKPACYEVAKGGTSFPSMNWKACLWEKEIRLCNGVTIPYTIVFARYIPAPPYGWRIEYMAYPIITCILVWLIHSSCHLEILHMNASSNILLSKCMTAWMSQLERKKSAWCLLDCTL